MACEVKMMMVTRFFPFNVPNFTPNIENSIKPYYCNMEDFKSLKEIHPQLYPYTEMHPRKREKQNTFWQYMD
jgi:hypothetical protein